MKDLFKELKRNKLDLDNIVDTIGKLDLMKLGEILEQLYYITIKKNTDLEISKESLFNFVANENLSGGNQCCAATECRIDRITELSHFAALYSDKVLIKNPLEIYVEYPIDYRFDEIIRSAALSDILLLWVIEPLLSNGIISFTQSMHHFCPDCYRKVSSTNIFNYESRIENAESVYRNILKEDLEVFAVNENNDVFIELNGPEHIIEHGKSFIHFQIEMPDEIKKYKNKEGRYRLNERSISKIGIYNKFCSQLIDDFAFQDWYTKNFDYTYLTNRDIEIRIIESVNSKVFNLKNKYLMNGLKHNMSTLTAAPLSKILKYRNNNKEQFDRYRFSLNRLIKDIKPNSEGEVREAFLDTVKPEIDSIERDLKNYRKNLIKDLGVEIAVNTGLVVLGLHSGLLPANIGAIAATVGGIGGITSTIKKGLEIAETPADVRKNPYFFLWKLKKKL